MRISRQCAYVGAYLVAIVVANLVVYRLGASASKVTAFFCIGMNLTVLDDLHELWRRRGLWWKMLLLISVGSALTWAFNAQAGRIGLASLVAFVASTIVDRVVYALLPRRQKWERVGWSNLASTLVDSLLFPSLAFGFSPWLTWDQFSAKLAGAQFWTLILFLRLRGRGTGGM